MTFRSSGLVELAGIGIDGFQHLGIFVVGHGLGGVQLPIQQQRHIKGLLDDGDIVGVFRVDVDSAHGGEELMLVAEAPGADAHALEVLHGLDAGIHERDFERAAALEDLRDIDQVHALLVGFQHFGHPGQSEFRAARGDDLLRHDFHRAFENGYIQPLVIVEAEVNSREVTGELRLRHPLQLQLDGRQVFVGAAESCAQRQYENEQECYRFTHELPPFVDCQPMTALHQV